MRTGTLTRLSVLALLLACACAQAGPAAGSVNGSVSVAPAHPGPQRAGEPGGRPFAGAAVVLRDHKGRVAARTVADAQGRFSLPARAGRYRVEIDAGRASLPRCEPVDVRVTGHRRVIVQIACDSGMR